MFTFPVCKQENFASLQAHRKRGICARASPTPHHTLNEERSACFTAQHLSALLVSKESRFNDRAGKCGMVRFTTQFFILDKAKALPIAGFQCHAIQNRSE